MITETKDYQAVAPLFAGWDETMIWSCLSGQMGHIYIPSDRQEAPVSAAAILGDFAFYVGRPDPELASFWPEDKENDFMIATGREDAWKELIEACYPGQFETNERFAFYKEPESLDPAKLQSFVDVLDPRFELKLIDEKLYEKCKEQEWSWDFVSLYHDYEDYQVHGLGILAMDGDKPVAGASSYNSYVNWKEAGAALDPWFPDRINGIEIEIDTSEDYKRLGLASACGAKLILEAIKKGWYASWDAANEISCHLAKKLGYRMHHAYQVAEINRVRKE